MPKQPSLPANRVPVPRDQRKGFSFEVPSGGAERALLSYAEWEKYHYDLGQELAKRMREYGGPAEQDEPPPGGTPVLMRMAA